MSCSSCSRAARYSAWCAERVRDKIEKKLKNLDNIDRLADCDKHTNVSPVSASASGTCTPAVPEPARPGAHVRAINNRSATSSAMQQV